jgi:hypothetical protein
MEEKIKMTKKYTRRLQMKKLIPLILVLFVFVSLFATNPSGTDFKEFAKDYAKKELEKSGVSNEGWVGALAGGISDAVVNLAVEKSMKAQDYYLFSIYEVKGIDKDYKFIGVFNKFIPLKK